MIYGIWTRFLNGALKSEMFILIVINLFFFLHSFFFPSQIIFFGEKCIFKCLITSFLRQRQLNYLKKFKKKKKTKVRIVSGPAAFTDRCSFKPYFQSFLFFFISFANFPFSMGNPAIFLNIFHFFEEKQYCWQISLKIKVSKPPSAKNFLSFLLILSFRFRCVFYQQKKNFSLIFFVLHLPCSQHLSSNSSILIDHSVVSVNTHTITFKSNQREKGLSHSPFRVIS